jgi:arylsulfatase A-like enzyme
MRSALVLAGLVLSGVAVARDPNVILILADDLGYGELGSYGQTKIKTPHLDKMADQGMRFTQFYSSSPVCAPTRASLLTGRHQGHASIRGNSEVGGWGLNEGEGQLPLPAREETLAEALKARGYATGAFGKWGLGGPGSEGHPLNQGFDTFVGYLCQRWAHNFYPTHLWNGHQVHILEQNTYFNPHTRLTPDTTDPTAFERFIGKQYSPQVMRDEALKFIDKNKDKPFFLYFPTPIPHASLQAPAEWVDRYPREWDTVPYFGQNGYTPNLRPRATYAAMISYMDDSIGQMLDRVQALGLEDDTIVIFTSDNGTSFNGGVDREFFNSLPGLRGYKTQMWEGGIRVPTIVKFPGRVPAGTVSKQVGVTHDLFNTVLAATGGRTRRVDSVNLWPAFTDASRVVARPHIYWEFPEGPGWQAVLLEGRYKGIRPNLRNRGLALELYDLQTDPMETTNIAAQRPDLVRKIEGLMRSERVPNPQFPLWVIDRPVPPPAN